jgi:hypothetical protein
MYKCKKLADDVRALAAVHSENPNQLGVLRVIGQYGSYLTLAHLQLLECRGETCQQREYNEL